ncbi:MAG TPA: hypothetical protein VK892_07270 [Pyrinomonadaceae bacterium]|nr:hypothetical protein [Pyrinomonadaceae bacterium]
MKQLNLKEISNLFSQSHHTQSENSQSLLKTTPKIMDENLYSQMLDRIKLPTDEIFYETQTIKTPSRVTETKKFHSKNVLSVLLTALLMLLIIIGTFFYFFISYKTVEKPIQQNIEINLQINYQGQFNYEKPNNSLNTRRKRKNR